MDLARVMPDTITLIEARGEDASPLAVLKTLGIALPPTLPEPVGMDDPSFGALPADDPVSLGRFQVLGELGRGGMGRVVEAWDPVMRRRAAVKLVIDPHSTSESQLARFAAEAQITGQLQHPNIVPVYEMGLTPEGELYFVMKKVEGRSLRHLLRALRGGDEATLQEWPPTRLLGAFVQLCQAMAYAHERGVLHRDLKPDNVMLGAFGEVLVMDWGVARLVGDAVEAVARAPLPALSLPHTMDGAAIGTPGFMSPEQARGGDVGPGRSQRCVEPGRLALRAADLASGVRGHRLLVADRGGRRGSAARTAGASPRAWHPRGDRRDLPPRDGALA